VSETHVEGLTQDERIHYHWLSLALYNLHCVLCDRKVNETTEAKIKFQFEGATYCIPTASLDKLLACWDNCDRRYADEIELFHTSMLCTALDRFLFWENAVGCCYHQLPFTKKQERADFYITSLDNQYLGEFVASADYKKN